MALQYVPLGSALVHFRMPILQAQDMPAMHVQGIASGRSSQMPELGDAAALLSNQSVRQSIADANIEVFRPGNHDLIELF